MRFLQVCSLVLPLVLLAACDGDDTSSSTSGSTTSTTTNPTGTGGGGTGGGGTGGGGTGGGGTGGSGGGVSWEGVNPIEGVGPEDVTQVETSFQFTEGTCWFPAEGVLRFTDVPGSRIHELDGQGNVTVWREPSGQANGLALAPDGDVVACEHQNRRVTRSATSDQPEVVADTYQGMQFNSPNDVIVRSDGTIYFTDPTYGGNPQEIPFQGVFRVAPGGAVSVVSDTFSQPNGIALSPDETILYVTDSDANELHSFPVNADGSTGQGQKILDAAGTPDGMAVDDGGNLYLATAAGIQVLRPDGTAWGTIPVPEQPSNCAFGDADRQTLFISARTSIYRVHLNIPGKP